MGAKAIFWASNFACKAVLLSDKGWTFRQISDALLLDEETVSRHVIEYQEKHKLSVQTGGSSGKLFSDQAHDLVAHLEKATYLKVLDICAYVLSQYAVVYTVSGMTSWLKNHGFSYKKPKPTPAKADPIKQAAFIQAYKTLLNDLNAAGATSHEKLHIQYVALWQR